MSPLGSYAPMSELSARFLSRRDRQVVRHLTEGRSHNKVAAFLNISVRTVETYRARVMLKLDLRSLAELVRYALGDDII